MPFCDCSYRYKAIVICRNSNDTKRRSDNAHFDPAIEIASLISPTLIVSAQSRKRVPSKESIFIRVVSSVFRLGKNGTLSQGRPETSIDDRSKQRVVV